MQSTKRNKLLLISVLLGMMLIAYSWYCSYPVTLSSSRDFVFNHVPVVYWFGISITFISLYLIAAESKSHILKWLVCPGFVIALYSLSYFYYTLSTSDSAWFRGQVEYLGKTGDLTPSQPYRPYFQWPSFFILTNIAISVSGLRLADFEFLQYTLIGFLMASTLYVYSSKNFKKGGFLAPILFFVSMSYFLNYQNVPFSLAFAILLVLWMLETRPKSTGMVLVMIVLFIGICLTHAFVPLFFVLYLLSRTILERSRQYGNLSLLALTIFSLVQLVMAHYSFVINVQSLFTLESEYSSAVQRTFVPISNQIDVVAQQLSRISTIAVILFCFIGFIYLLIRKRMRNLDKAIFLAGVVYSCQGVVLYTLGSRAIPIVFIPVSLGASYLFETRFSRYIKFIVVVLLILIVFVPIHNSFSDPNNPIQPQTKEAYTTANFIIEKYDWNLSTVILSDLTSNAYLAPQVAGNVLIQNVVQQSLSSPIIEPYDCIIYNVGFEKALQLSGISAEEVSQKIQSEFHVVYDSGFSYVAVRPRLPSN